MTNAMKVKRALVDAIGQHPTFRNRQVSLHHPGADMELECAFIASVSNTESARMIGKAHRREELSVEVAIVAEVLGGDSDDCGERAYTMLKAVEEAVAQDSSLGGICLMCEVTGFQETSFRGMEREVTEIQTTVRVVANKDYEE